MIRLLLVEHNTFVGAGLAYLLEKETDIEVAGICRDGNDVLGRVRAVRPGVVILDLHLNDVNSIELAGKLLEEGSGIRVLITMEQAREQEVYDLLSCGVSGFVTKQDEPETVFQAIRSVAHGEKIWLSPRVSGKLIGRRWGADPDRLSKREQAILLMIARGINNRQIADDLHLSLGTIKNQVSMIYGKLAVRSRADAVAWAWQKGLVGRESDSAIG